MTLRQNEHDKKQIGEYAILKSDSQSKITCSTLFCNKWRGLMIFPCSGVATSFDEGARFGC